MGRQAAYRGVYGEVWIPSIWGSNLDDAVLHTLWGDLVQVFDGVRPFLLGRSEGGSLGDAVDVMTWR